MTQPSNEPETQTVAQTSAGKSSRKGLVAFVVILALAAGLAAVFAGRRGQELELEISLSRDRFLQGAPIPMKFAVENVSDRPVELDRFTPVDAERCDGLDGKPVDLVLYYEHLPDPILHLRPQPGDAGLGALEPGKTLELRCNIAELFGLIKPGSYTLRGSYVRDRWAQDGSVAWAARLWSSVLRHDDVRFEVVSRIYDTQNEKVTKYGERMQ